MYWLEHPPDIAVADPPGQLQLIAEPFKGFSV